MIATSPISKSVQAMIEAQTLWIPGRAMRHALRHNEYKQVECLDNGNPLVGTESQFGEEWF